MRLPKELSLTAEFKKGFLETTKQSLRLVVYSMIPNICLIMKTGEIGWRILLSEYMLIFLGALEKFTHEYFKAKAKTEAREKQVPYVSKPRGLLPF